MPVTELQLLEMHCWKIYKERGDILIILKGRKDWKTLVKHQLADKIEGHKKEKTGRETRMERNGINTNMSGAQIL